MSQRSRLVIVAGLPGSGKTLSPANLKRRSLLSGYPQMIG